MSPSVPRFVSFLHADAIARLLACAVMICGIIILCTAYRDGADERLGFLGGIFPLITGILFELLGALGRRRFFKGIAHVVEAGKASEKQIAAMVSHSIEDLGAKIGRASLLGVILTFVATCVFFWRSDDASTASPSLSLFAISLLVCMEFSHFLSLSFARLLAHRDLDAIAFPSV